MDNYKEIYEEEINYLNDIIQLLEYKLKEESEELEDKKTDLIASRKEMWENTTHSSSDYDKLSDLNQYLSSLQAQTFTYTEQAKRISKYEKMLDNPYFARIDFKECGYDDTEKIYIGLFNLMDDQTHDIKVFDWRAPVSSLYYRNDIGFAEYDAPGGKIKGEVLLKRQYKIEKGKMEYFFDSKINIVDEMLREALSQNMTNKMKTIVETIQKQQDLIIRDLENELLIVQGVAGSGKTSVALHRIAFLLYQSLNLKLNSNNIIVISPNSLFSKYISNVLPELGERNIQEVTFENIFSNIFENKLSMKTRSEYFENIVCMENEKKQEFLRDITNFKGSEIFIEIINRFIRYFEKNIIKFEDIYFNNKHLESRELLKDLLISKKLDMPTAKKLKIIEARIMEQVNAQKKERREKIEMAVNKLNNHEFEIKSFTRVLAAKETMLFLQRLRKVTDINIYNMYKMLFSDKNLFYKLAKGLNLPYNIEKIIEYTNDNIKDPYNIPYSDGISLIYMKIKAEGCDLFGSIKQVIVDEAQDYYDIHYKILNELFKSSRFTIVGDINQSIEKKVDIAIYDNIIKILNKKKYNKIVLNKSYRSSYEINKFASKFLDYDTKTEYFKRNEEKPEVMFAKNNEILEKNIVEQIKIYQKENFQSIAIICKSRKEASKVYFNLKGKIDINLIDYKGDQVMSGVMVLPVFLAKGLEFDAVIVYEVNEKNYETLYDKKLLYIACTRALHRLSLHHTLKCTKFLDSKY